LASLQDNFPYLLRQCQKAQGFWRYENSSVLKRFSRWLWNFSIFHHNCSMMNCHKGNSDHMVQMNQSSWQKNLCALNFVIFNVRASCRQVFVKKHIIW